MTHTVPDLPWLSGQMTDLDELREARSRSWVGRSDRGLEVLTYDEGFQVLEHPELLKGPSWTRRLDELGVDGEARRYYDMAVPATEGAYRKKLRAPLGALFRPSRVAKLREAVRRIARDAVEEIEPASSVDLMAQLCRVVPPRVYCELVSMPYELAPEVARISDVTLGALLTVDHSRKQEAMDAMLAAVELVREHLEARRNNLGDDFTSVMIRQQMDGMLTEDELFAEALSILQASVDNTMHEMGNVFGMLLTQPQRWQDFLGDRELCGSIIDEVIRLYPRFGTIFRYAPGEVVINDQVVPADSWVFVSVRAGQRDPQVFTEPDEYRLDRPTKRALMFGAGTYNCLGQGLARLEIEEALRAVADRYPGLSLTDPWLRRDTNAVTETTQLQVSLG